MSTFLNSTKSQFQYYKQLAERAIEPLSIEQLQWSAGVQSNSIETIMRHIGGNLISRWTDFLTTDGEKEWRKRDEEFTDTFESKKYLLDYWNKAWDILFQEYVTLTEDDLEKTIYIRNEAHSVTKAIQRQLAHNAYHIGQIVYLAKVLQGDNWKALTIPLGGSDAFNDSMNKD